METAELLPLPATVEHMADADITAAIELLFTTKKGVSAHLIDVATSEGAVTLTGFIDNLLARSRAEEIALAVRGVRSVANELVIRPVVLPDAVLTENVARALADDPATSGYNVQCAVAAGSVTVTGTVQSWAEKQLVLRVLQGVRGVRHIGADHLQVRGGGLLNSDEEITTQIREFLDWDICVNSALVEVRTNEQVVHLSGTVGTATEKARIVATAYQTGATRVDARDLFVAYWALGRELRREKFSPRADADIVRAVRATFIHDPRVQAFEPLVQVHQGVVTLAGTVSNLRAKQDAEKYARHIVGVWDLHNLLKVRTEPLVPDADIGQTILAALSRDPYVGHCHFEVTVHNGKAYLAGRVTSHFEQVQAGEVACGVSGVVAMENHVAVPGSYGRNGLLDSPPPLAADPDRALAGRIRQRYFWSAHLHDQEVAVQVANGRATLSGTVDTWLDRRQAALDAYEAGAHDVNNHLRVTTALPLEKHGDFFATADEISA